MSVLFQKYDGKCVAGDFDIPTIQATDVIPEKLIGFNYARTSKDYNSCIHFFLDDYQFERCWNNPEPNIEVLSKFKCCLTPDFSLFRDMPRAMMVWNVYRSRLFGQMCERAGLTVVPTIQYAGPESYDFCFDGLPKHSTVAISSVGCAKDPVATELFVRGFNEMVARIQPKTVLYYGKNILPKMQSKMDFNVVEFSSFTQKFKINKEMR